MKLPIVKEQPVEFSFESLANFVRPIYLDNNATTQVDDNAVSEMLRALEKDYANPSGIHTAGKIAKRNIEIARSNIADFIGCMPTEIVFASGGTEAINSAINSVIKTHHPRRNVITCLTEHSATLNKLKEEIRCDVSYLDVDREGRFGLEQLERFLKDKPHMNLLVTLMAANNETGTIHKNLFAAIELTHKYGALFHVDAVQIAGKLALKPYIDAGTDFLTISGHKFHAPKGIGVLFIKDKTPFASTIIGGYQENTRRAGTENVPAIVGFGAVAKKMPIITTLMIKLHHKFINALLNRIPSCIINGGDIPGTINVGFKYVHREAMVAKCSQYELYASVGSACAKGIEPSHVLKAMTVAQEYIHGSVRFSLSKYTTEEEIDRSINIIEQAYTDIRKISLGIIL